MKMKLMVVIAVAGLLSACGGGGGGDSSPASPAAPGGTTGPVALTNCALEYIGQAAIYDADDSGFTTWLNTRVICTAPGSTQSETVAGLEQGAFKIAGAEGLVHGTSGVDGGPTYMLQIHKAASVREETISVDGVDDKGRSIKFSQAIDYRRTSPFKLIDHTLGGALAGSRVIDADGKGYVATVFAFMPAAMKSSSAAACPQPSPGNVTQFVLSGNNAQGQPVDARMCLYKDLTAANVPAAGLQSLLQAYSFRNGANAGLAPDELKVTEVSLVADTANLPRVPVYKVTMTVRYSQAALPNFQTVTDAGVPGLNYEIPAVAASATWDWISPTLGVAGPVGGLWPR